MERQKKDSKTGVKGFTMVTRCCLSESSQNFGQRVTDYQRGPQSPTEGHRGLLRATKPRGALKSQVKTDVRPNQLAEEKKTIPLVVENVLLLFNLCFWLADIHQECLFEKI